MIISLVPVILDLSTFLYIRLVRLSQPEIKNKSADYKDKNAYKSSG